MATYDTTAPTVFVIKDSTKGRELTRFLRIKGCYVIEENSTRNAIDMALDFTSAKRPDLILINWGEFNEHPLAISILREGLDLHNVPILAILDSRSEQLTEEAYNSGLDDFIDSRIDLTQKNKLLTYLPFTPAKAAA